MSRFSIRKAGRRLKEEKEKGMKNLSLFLLSRFLRYSHLCYFFILQLDGLKIRFSPLAIPTSLFVHGDLEPETTAFFHNHLRKGDVYIDVGSNVGTTTLIAAKIVENEGVVLCFEPNGRVYKSLVDNIKLNNFANILARQCALGDKSGHIMFSDKNNDDMNKVSITENGNTVTLSTLDAYTKHFTTIHLLKIDVEGYEMNVLRGAIETLKKTKMVFFESIEHNAQHYGFRISDLITFLRSQHFRVTDLEFIKEYHGNENAVSYPYNLIAVRD